MAVHGVERKEPHDSSDGEINRKGYAGAFLGIVCGIGIGFGIYAGMEKIAHRHDVATQYPKENH